MNSLSAAQEVPFVSALKEFPVIKCCRSWL